MRLQALSAAMLLTGWAVPVAADWTQARCDIYPAGSDHAERMVPCTFAQRQGHVTITRQDGVTHNLSPVGDRPGNFRDAKGYAVYRQSGLGDQGQIFRFKEESVFVYWDTSALHPDDKNNPTSPFTTKDYDATTLLRCRSTDEASFATCPAGILRMENRQASITVMSRNGERFTINFMTGYVNATNREAKARLEGDTWIVIIDAAEVYEVPLPAIEGG